MKTSDNEEYIEYRDSYGNNQVARQAFIESLGEQFKQRCRESDGADGVIEIIDEMKINYYTFITWKNKYPILAECFQQGKFILADRMRKNALRNKLNANLSFRLLGSLNPEYNEAFAKVEALKQPAEQQDKVKYIVMKDIRPTEFDNELD